jgi:hypothetical protein
LQVLRAAAQQTQVLRCKMMKILTATQPQYAIHDSIALYSQGKLIPHFNAYLPRT